MTREEAIHIAINYCNKKKITYPLTVHARAYVGKKYETDFLDVEGLRWEVFFTHEEEKNIPHESLTKKQQEKLIKLKNQLKKCATMDGPFNIPLTIIVHPNGECRRKH